MTAGRRPALDRFRLAAAVLVVCNHTGPLSTWWPTGNFWLVEVLARLAVPFFFMVSGCFLAEKDPVGRHRFWKRTGLFYLCAVALYLPLNWYAGQLTPDLARRFFTDGTFYHLWYFPAVLLGVPVAFGLLRLGRPAALTAAAVLYLIGLGGDSYYGLATQLPGGAAFYGFLFHLWDCTRNGLFFAPLFLLLGTADIHFSRRTASAGLALGLGLMTVEGLWLHRLGAQRHSSMYLALPLCMVCLFSLLRSADGGRDRRAAELSALVYLIHPWCIVLVRGVAGALGLEAEFVDNSLGHFLAVLVLSLTGAKIICTLRPLPLLRRARAWRELDLKALDHNVKALRAILPPGQDLMAVVKADAYGHGAVPVARRLQRNGVRAFAVACLSEGVALRRAGIRDTILVLGWTDPADVPRLRRWHLTQAVADEAHGLALSAQGSPVRVHLALDTGMHRLGIPVEDRTAIARMYALPNLRITGVFSHLCVADSLTEADAAYTAGQLKRFYEAVSWMRQAGLDPGAIHVQSSYGLLNLPPQPCAWARAGIALYGVRSDGASTAADPDLWPVLSLRARVASVRALAAGEGAGYGLAFRAKRETRLAVVTIGYGDGLPRSLPQRGGEVLLNGHRCPMVGRMCMDQLLVDVTEAGQIRPGDVATLLGRDGAEVLSAEEMATRCGTITNELLSRLGHRLTLVRRDQP